MSATIIVVASFGLGFATWLLPASITINSWSRAGMDRVAIFAPLYRLWVVLGVSAALAGFLWLGGDRSPNARARRALVIAPAAALWLWTVPFVPWLGEQFPLLLLLGGPLRWPIAAAVSVTIAWRIFPVRTWVARLNAPIARGWVRSHARGVVFVVSLAVYLALGLHSLTTLGLGGDEPHYLVITQSLLLDHDLKIQNNHDRGDYRAFYPGDLKPDYLQRGVDGEIYSIHAPGLPALLLPGFALFGSRGAIATVCLLAALAALAIFDTARLVGGFGVAWATWASLCFSVPLIPHAWSLYPEIAAAAIVAWAVSWAVELVPATAAVWFARGVCLAILPWLHTKLVVILAVMGLWLMIELRSRVKALLAFTAPIALSSVAWFAFFYIVYGTLDPQAPYAGQAQQFVRLENLPRSILGFLIDQKFGLLVYAPIYLAAAAGVWLLFQDGRRRPFAVGLLVALLAYLLGSARYYMWWGGSSAPARFMVPLVPVLAPMVAAAFAVGRGALARTFLWILAAMGLLVSAVAVLGPDQRLLFSDPHGTARLLEMLQGSVPLTAVFPTFTDENWHEPLRHALPWVGGALAAGFVVFFARRLFSSFWLATVAGTTVLVVAAVAVGPAATESRAESVTRGRLALMQAFDPGRLRTFDYAARARMSPEQWIRQSAIAIDLDPAVPADGYGRLTEPLTLAPGQYQVKVWFQNRAIDGDLLLAMRDGQVLRRVPGPLANPTVETFDLPAGLPELWVQLAVPAAAQQAVRVELTPLALVPVSERPNLDVHAVESIPGRPNAQLLYVNADTFPEGGVFWTHGTDRGDVLVVPAGARQILLTLHVGPVGGTVRVTAGSAGRREDVVLEPGETRTISIPVGDADAARYVPISIQAPASFRPAEVDPSSSDTRDLGCQVRVELK
jgi:hypothetical protein